MTDPIPTAPAAPLPPAGWYPEGVNGQRYWDGAAWTEHRAPAAQMVVLPPRPKNKEATPAIVFMILTIVACLTVILAGLAWIFAIVGLCVGIAGVRESAKLPGNLGRARCVWAIVICGGGLLIGVLAGISYIVNR